MTSIQQQPFPQPWLAGVCAWLAWQMNWHVSGVRIGALLLLFLMPVATAVAYLLGALCLGFRCERGCLPAQRREPADEGPLGRRIDAMEARLRAFDEELERRRNWRP